MVVAAQRNNHQPEPIES